MKSHDEVRESVTRAYATAATKPVEKASQGCGCGCATSAGETATLAGYQGDALNAIPQDAVTHSFGCGDPLSFSEVGPGNVVLDLGSGQAAGGN